MSQRFRSRAAVAIAAAAAGVVATGLSAAAPVSAATPGTSTLTVRVVASGLDNPKHLTFGPGGLYVAESGAGGSTCVTIDGFTLCEGATGSVAVVNAFGTHTVLSGLPSVIGNGTVGGPSAVTFDKRELAVLIQDVAGNPDGTTSVQGPGAQAFGKLVLARPLAASSGWTFAADIAAFAAANPQDPATLGGLPGLETPYESNPYDIIPFRGGYAIADAAANDVLWLSPRGSLSVLGRLPTTPMPFNGTTVDAQAVPTSLAIGPDGALYVGTAIGVPSLPGTAAVYRLMPGHAPIVAASGLTAVTSIAFDHRGNLLALEFNTGGLLAPPSTPGALVRVNLAAGTSTTLPVSLPEPTGLLVGPGGSVYVATNGNAGAGAGQVLKISGLG
jgi:hypothetical protein